MTFNDTMSDVISKVLEEQTARAVVFTDGEDYANAGAIINEWTTSDGDCILTYYLKMELDCIQEELLYVNLKDTEVIYGTFSFVPPVELPTDNI
jgi:hypothetical protein